MKGHKRDSITMLVIMALCLLAIFKFIPAQIRLPANSNSFFTNRTFPQFTITVVFMAAGCCFFFSLYQCWKMRKHSGTKSSEESQAELSTELVPLLGAAIILVYAFLFKILSGAIRGYGFIISTVLFIPAFLILMKCKKWQYYVSCYGFACVMYFVFRYILKVMLR